MCFLHKCDGHSGILQRLDRLGITFGPVPPVNPVVSTVKMYCRLCACNRPHCMFQHCLLIMIRLQPDAYLLALNPNPKSWHRNGCMLLWHVHVSLACSLGMLRLTSHSIQKESHAAMLRCLSAGCLAGLLHQKLLCHLSSNSRQQQLGPPPEADWNLV